MPANPVDKKALHAYTSHEAWDGWDGLATLGGSNVTAILEYVGLQLFDALQDVEDLDQLSDLYRGWVKGAIGIANERRRRGQSKNARRR